MMEFTVSNHLIEGKDSKVIEVWDEHEFIGSIYATRNGVKIVSKFMKVAKSGKDAIGYDDPLVLEVDIMNLRQWNEKGVGLNERR